MKTTTISSYETISTVELRNQFSRALENCDYNAQDKMIDFAVELGYTDLAEQFIALQEETCSDCGGTGTVEMSYDFGQDVKTIKCHCSY
jgi:hypothetical protein